MKKKTDINEKISDIPGFESSTVIHIAASYGLTYVVAYLIYEGANTNTEDKYGTHSFNVSIQT